MTSTTLTDPVDSSFRMLFQFGLCPPSFFSISGVRPTSRTGIWATLFSSRFVAVQKVEVRSIPGIFLRWSAIGWVIVAPVARKMVSMWKRSFKAMVLFLHTWNLRLVEEWFECSSFVGKGPRKPRCPHIMPSTSSHPTTHFSAVKDVPPHRMAL